jgi:transcriptional regulator with XRE-family HTH domain
MSLVFHYAILCFGAMTIFEDLSGPLTIGALIKAHRTSHDLSQEQLAKKLKTTKALVQQVENGKKKLTLKETLKWAKKLEEFEDFFAIVWFKSEAREAGLDFSQFLRKARD